MEKITFNRNDSVFSIYICFGNGVRKFEKAKIETTLMDLGYHYAGEQSEEGVTTSEYRLAEEVDKGLGITQR